MDTLLIIKDTIAVKMVNTADLCQKCAKQTVTNENDVALIGNYCDTFVKILLIVALSLLIYYLLTWSRSWHQHKAEREEDKEDNLFSLRKEYLNNLLDSLKAKNDSQDQNKEYIEELRKSIEWIDSQKK